jgi:D-apiose dehydrogenase
MSTPQPLGNKRLRVVVAGAGWISSFHLTGWAQMSNVELAAICDTDLDRAREKAKTFQIDRAYTEFERMLDREKPDAVDILTPVGTHAVLTRKAAARGVHVMCQKPMVPTVAEAEALLKAVGTRIRFMVHENFRFRPHYLVVRDWLEAGRIGEIRSARLSVRSSGLLPRGAEPPVILERQPYLAAFPRLLIFEALIHHLDVLRCLLGELRVVSTVLARVNPLLAGEDVAAISLQGKDGLIALLDGNFSAPGYPALPSDRLELIGSRGTLLFDGERLSLAGSPAPPVVFDPEKNYQVCFTTAIQHFVEGLRTGAPFATDARDNLETLKLMEACYVTAHIPV